MKLSVLSRWYRVLLLPVAVLLGLTACEEADNPAAVLEIPKESQEYFNNGVSFSATPAEGALSVKVSFKTSMDWTVTSEETKTVPWLTVSPLSGKAGSAEITITAQENTTEQLRSAKVLITCGEIIKTIKVTQKAGSKPGPSTVTVNLDKASAQMKVGETLELIATVLPDQEAVWFSSDEKVATVAGEHRSVLDGTYTNVGTVTAIGEGEAIITAKVGAVQATCKITVTAGGGPGDDKVEATSITLNKTEITLVTGQSEQLEITEILPENVTEKNALWVSSNPDIAVVIEKDEEIEGVSYKGGLVTGRDLGETTITAYLGTAKASCKVTVISGGGDVTLESLAIDPAPVTLAIDEEQVLTAVFQPSEAKVKVEWKCDNPDLVAIGALSDTQAKIQGLAPGKTTVTATAGGKSATCEVTVKEGSSTVAVESITLDPTSLELLVGQSGQINATVYPENATNKNLIWTSSDIYNVYVVNGGQVTAYGVCEATITVTSVSNPNVTATCKVTVKEETVDEIVDLGLSVKWRAWNLGATKPEEYGNYYAWGETEPKTEYWTSNYKWADNSTDPAGLTKYNDSETAPSGKTPDNLMRMEMEDDAAHVILGEDWHIPSGADIEELCDNCTWELITVNGVKGFKFTSKINGKSIFLPGAGIKINNSFRLTDNYFGYYWTSEVSLNWYAHYFRFETSAFNGVLIAGVDAYSRKNGMSIRPVKGEVIDVSSISVSETKVKLEIGQTKQLTATVLPANTSYKLISWTSGNPSVATVENGLVTAVAAGEALIMVKAGDKMAECIVTVKEPGPEPSLPVPEAVDLGLSVKWASFNLGATAPEQSGYYYAWGETSPKSEYTQDNYKFHKVTHYATYNTYDLTKYCSDSHNGYVDYKKTLDLEDDAAYMNLGGSWRMPSFSEAVELLDQCAWTFDNDKHGYNVKGPSGNSIFLPLAKYYEGSLLVPSIYKGEYWTNYLDTDRGAKIIKLYEPEEFDPVSGYYDGRYKGLTIRPVLDEDM